MVIYSYGDDYMDKSYLITKSNYFIMNSGYDLSLEEQKLILTLASMVQPNDEEFKPYIFKISEFIKLLGIENQTKYTEVPKITRELIKKVLEIQEGNTLLQVAWLSSARYEKGSGMVVLKFSPDLKPYMLQLKENFTQYQLANILTMKSKYSPRIYEILKCNEFKKQGYFKIEMEELRKLLKADSIYPLYADFKRFIIHRAQKELHEKTDLYFEFEEIKTGRKVTSIKFIIHSKDKAKDKAKYETAAAKIMPIENAPNDLISQVQAICYKHKISEYEASCILSDANNNLDLIKNRYKYLLTQKNVNNMVGYMRSIIITYDKAQKNIKIDNFNNYEQREYDYEKLEKGLTAWQK